MFAGIHIFGSLAASTARSTDLRPAVQADERFLWFNFPTAARGRPPPTLLARADEAIE